MLEPAPAYTELPQEHVSCPDPLASPPVRLGSPPAAYRPPPQLEPLHDDPPDDPNETEAVQANLQHWSSAETKRRKSVRQARRAEALNEIAPIRRMSTRRRNQRRPPSPPPPEGSPASATTATVGPADGSGAGTGPNTTSPPSSAGPLPGAPDHLPRTSPSEATGTSLGEHQEVDMLRTSHVQGASSQSRNVHSPQGSQGSNKPQPTRARPIVTAGPAPVREMRAQDAAAVAEANNAELTAEEEAHRDQIKEEIAADGKRRRRGFWLTDLLCCNLGSNPEEEQAGKTNPNE